MAIPSRVVTAPSSSTNRSTVDVGRSELIQVGVDALVVATLLRTSLAAGTFDQDAAHSFGGGGVEVTTTVPVPIRVTPDEPEVCLVNQGGRLESLPRLFAHHLCSGKAAKLPIDQGQQLIGGVGVAVIDRIQQPGNVIHGWCCYSRSEISRRQFVRLSQWTVDEQARRNGPQSFHY